MAVNIEIKAWARLPGRQKELSGGLATAAPEHLEQVDTFFEVPRGRLKLRQFSEERGQVIHYRREDIAGPKSSDYALADTREPEAMRAVLAGALGVCGEVRKRRIVFLAGQTRIHFDEVEGLGFFLELEVVLREGQSRAEGESIARALMKELLIQDDDLIDVAYVDLLAGKGAREDSEVSRG